MTPNEYQLTINAETFLLSGKGIVTLCGSTRFFFEAMEVNRRLTFAGWMVFSCGSWGHSFHKYSGDSSRDYSDVKELHFLKIDVSQAIVVVSDTSGYKEKSTEAEIEYAASKKIPTFYFDGVSFFGETEVHPSIPFWYELRKGDIKKYGETHSLGY